MLTATWPQRDRCEVVGHFVLLAGLGSLFGRYPPGNTGRTAMALTAHGLVPPKIADLLPPR